MSDNTNKSESRRQPTIAKPQKAPLWLLSLLFTYTAFLILLTVVNQSGADRWWPGAFNLYLPQAIWALPGLFLLFVVFKVDRRWIWLPLLGIVWVAGPLMGFCWPTHGKQESMGGLPLRVMTWNVKYGRHDKFAQQALIYDIDWNNPAVVLLQDAGGILNGSLGKYFKKWNIRSYGQYVVASRFPLGELQIRQLSFPGKGRFCVRVPLQIGGTTLVLYNVHLESPRLGLNALRVVRKEPGHLPGAVQSLENNVETRFTQVQALQEYVRQERSPVILAGDLNSPEASLVCSTLRGVGLHDAFGEGGRGYGYTYGHFLLQHRLSGLNYSWMRIDHIMMSSHLRTRRCWTGTGEASDHRPVIADLILKQH